MLKYRCLVLDHDDTVVKSTPEIHFPVFKKTLAKLRPGFELTLEDFIGYCFHPGFNDFCCDILKFTEQEMDYQVSAWKEYVSRHTPAVYEGMERIIRTQKEQDGAICVVSHSHSENILRDYKENALAEPDMVFGWELGEDKRKPNPYPLRQIMQSLNLQPEELLMVDDLKPGYDMACSCGVDFACAGWSNNIPVIRDYMRSNCRNYFASVKELEEFLFAE